MTGAATRCSGESAVLHQLLTCKSMQAAVWLRLRVAAEHQLQAGLHHHHHHVTNQAPIASWLASIVN
jgi:hypothetical protein